MVVMMVMMIMRLVRVRYGMVWYGVQCTLCTCEVFSYESSDDDNEAG